MTALPPASAFAGDRSPWILPAIRPFNPLSPPTRSTAPATSGPPVILVTPTLQAGLDMRQYAEVMQKIHLATTQPMSADCKATLLQSAYREIHTAVTALEESTIPLSPGQSKTLSQCKSLMKSLVRLFRLLLGLDLSEEEIEVLLEQGVRPVAPPNGGMPEKEPKSQDFNPQKGAAPMFQDQNKGSQARAQSQKDPEPSEEAEASPSNPFAMGAFRNLPGSLRFQHRPALSPQELLCLGGQLLKDAQTLPGRQSKLPLLLMALICLSEGSAALNSSASNQEPS